MGNIKIEPYQLSDTILKIMDEYAGDAREVVSEACIKASKDAAKKLKQTSPKRTGKYAASWKSKTTAFTSLGVETTVYAGRYRLTHLLEKGHAKRGGGRVAAIVHIKPVEEEAIRQVEEDIREGLSR